MNKKSKRVTIKDIAERCGVTANTVSRALRNDAGISQATAKKVCEIADEMGYIRNSYAAAMRSGDSKLIAIIVDDIQNPHNATLINKMSLLLKEKGYDTMTMYTYGSCRNELSMAKRAIASMAAGVLHFPDSDDTKSASLIKQNQIPLVLIDREIHGIQTDVVRIDDYRGACIAADYLYLRGHRKFAYLGGPARNGAQTLRQQGFLDTLAGHGTGMADIRVLDADVVYTAIYNDVILQAFSPFEYTGIFAFNDQIAYHVINALRGGGYRVPEDISVIGFDHIRGGLPYLPPLSSVSSVCDQALAERAVSLLLKRMEDPNAEFVTEILPAKLYEAESTVSSRTE